MNTAKALLAIWLMAFLTGCSTVTPYTMDVAKRSALFGKLTPQQAADVIRAKASIGGSDADSGTFVADQEGFSYTKTTQETKTEWQGRKPVEKKYTSTLTRNIPWNAIASLEAFREEYEIKLLGTFHRVHVTFDTIAVVDSKRVRERHDLTFTCRTSDDLADVLAALRVLTGR